METKNAFESIKIRSLAFWMFLSIIASIFIMATINLELEAPLFDVAFMFLFYGIILIWIMWKFKSFDVDYKKIVGKFPNNYKWWAVGIVGIVVLLILFSLGAYWVIYYPLSFIVPSYVYGVLNETSFYTTASTAPPLVYNLLLILGGVIVAPIVEEFLFRGVILQRLALKWGTTLGMLISSFIFGIFHADIIGAFIFGIFMSILYINTRTLLVPIACHMLNNLLAFGLGFIGFIWDGGETATTLAQFQSDVWSGAIPLLISAPIVIYYIYKNWPEKDIKLPYLS